MTVFIVYAPKDLNILNIVFGEYDLAKKKFISILDYNNLRGTLEMKKKIKKGNIVNAGEDLYQGFKLPNKYKKLLIKEVFNT